jgi:hypothetical protein
MANTSRVNGLRPVRTLSGVPFKIEEFCMTTNDGTATFVGDLVKLSGTGHTDGTPEVIQCAAGDTAVGVVVSFSPDPTNLNLLYRTASTLRRCQVITSPDVVYEIEEDSVGGAMAVTDIGKCGDVAVGAGSTTTGYSGMTLDSSNVQAVDAGGQLRVLRLVPREDNAIGANAKWEVIIAEHSYLGATDI